MSSYSTSGRLLEGRGGGNPILKPWTCEFAPSDIFHVLKMKDKLEKYLMVKNLKIFRTI
jgi:hypothetical protein